MPQEKSGVLARNSVVLTVHIVPGRRLKHTGVLRSTAAVVHEILAGTRAAKQQAVPSERYHTRRTNFQDPGENWPVPTCTGIDRVKCWINALIERKSWTAFNLKTPPTTTNFHVKRRCNAGADWP